MPINKILPDGKVEIYNSVTGEKKVVTPEELPQYGKKLYGSYQEQLKTDQQIQAAQQMLESGSKPADLAFPESVQAQAQANIVTSGKKTKGVPTESDATLGAIEELKRLYNQPTAQGARPNPNRQDDLSMGSEGTPAFLSELGAGMQIAFNNAPDAKTYDRQKKAFTAQLKKLTGDTGILTNQDYDRLVGALPSFGDSDESAQKAWESFDAISTEVLGKTSETNYAAGRGKTPEEQAQMIAKGGNQAPAMQQTPEGLQMTINPASLAKDSAQTLAQMIPGPQQGLGYINQALDTPLGDMFGGRTKAARGKLMEGQIPSLDETVGVLGENASNAALLLSGGASSLPAAALKLAAPGVIRGATQPGASAQQRGVNALLEGGLSAATLGAGKFLKGIPGVVSGKAKNAAAQTRNQIAETIAEKMPVASLKAEGDRLAKNLPDVANKWKTEAKGLTDDVTAKQLVEKIDYWGKAFKDSGEVKDTASATLYSNLQRAAKDILKDKAPEVLAAHKILQNEAKKKGMVQGVKKIAYPTAIAAGASIPLSAALYAAANKIFGNQSSSGQ